MDGSRWERLAPLTGVVFTVLAVAGNALQGSSPDFLDEPQKIVDFYVDSSDTIGLGMNLAAVSLVFLVWFFASLRRTLLAAEGGDGRLASIAFGGGLVATALLMASFALNGLGGLRAGEDDTIGAEVAVVLYDGSSILAGLGATMAMVVVLVATAIAVFRFRPLPSWLGWVSVLLAVIGLFGPISWVLLLLFPLWVLVTSILLYQRQAPLSPAPSSRESPPPVAAP